MKIGILIAGFPPEVIGGAEIQTAGCAKYLAKNGHSVIVFTRRYKRSPLREKRDGYTIVRRRVLNIWGIRFIVDVILCLRDLFFNRNNLDVIIAYMFIINGIIATIAKRFFRIPFAVSERIDSAYKIEHSMKNRIFVPFVLKNANLVLLQSKLIKSDLLKELSKSRMNSLVELVSKKILIVPNGIEIWKAEIEEKREGIIYIGSLIPRKGVDFLIEAFRDLDNIKDELIIIGDGPERCRLESKARGLNIKFIGTVQPDKVKEYLKKAKFLILPSFSEGMPNVVMEAMASGIPVITTKIAGIPELIQHGVNGFLVDPRDSRKLTKHMRILAENDELRSKFGRKCLAEIRKYDWNKVICLLEHNLTKLTMST